MRYAVENGNAVLYIDNLGFVGNAGDPHTKVTNFGGFGTQDVYAAPVTLLTRKMVKRLIRMEPMLSLAPQNLAQRATSFYTTFTAFKKL